MITLLKNCEGINLTSVAARGSLQYLKIFSMLSQEQKLNRNFKYIFP